jgi:hypothetical protein
LTMTAISFCKSREYKPKLTTTGPSTSNRTLELGLMSTSATLT